MYDNMALMPHLSLKKTIQHSLEANDLNAVAVLARENRKALSLLVRLAYAKDTLMGQRAIRAMGLVAQELVKTEPEILRDRVRKLLWSLNDESGGIGWSAPELLGEIVSADPDRFADVIPLIADVYGIEEKVFRPGVLYALGRIAESAPARIVPFLAVIEQGLTDDDPEVRARALQAAGRIKAHLDQKSQERLEQGMKGLLADEAEVWIYGEKDFKGREIREVAQEELDR